MTFTNNETNDDYLNYRLYIYTFIHVSAVQNEKYTCKYTHRHIGKIIYAYIQITSNNHTNNRTYFVSCFFSKNPYLISSVPPCNVCQGARFPMTKSTQFFQHRLNGSAFAQQVLPTFVRVIDLQFQAQKNKCQAQKQFV